MKITKELENPLAVLPNLEFEELVALRDDLEKLINQKQQDGQEEMYANMLELARAAGFKSVEECVKLSHGESPSRKDKEVKPSPQHLSENVESAQTGNEKASLAIIDFETTGLSPNEGARATEIAAVIWQDGRIVRHYQSLLNAGVSVPYFITSLTGITNDMVRRAPSAAQVMCEVADFVGDLPLVAHNASFDRKFWDAELALIGRTRQQEFACSMLVARRIYPNSPNHKLGTLATFAKLPSTGKAHRAMADVELTAHLLCHMEATLAQRFQIPYISHELLRSLQKAKVSNIQTCLKKFMTSS